MDFDLLVIGAGSGGVRAARKAAETGAKVAVVEASDLGGTCVNLGCVPKKLMMYAAHFGGYSRIAEGSGWSRVTRSHDWSAFLRRKNAEISRLNGIYRDLLERAGVTLICGYGQFVRPHVVAVDGREYSARRILVTCGTTPSMPQVPGIEYCLSSDDIFHIAEMPRRVVIVGGGYIATEFAGILHGLGVAVTQLYRGELFLRGFDRTVRELLVTEMRKRGIDVRFQADVVSVARDASGLSVTLKDKTCIRTDSVLYAVGRHPNTARLRLDKAGIAVDARGYITVNDCFETSQPDHYALGDILGRVSLTPVAIREAMQLVRYLYGDGQTPGLNYEMIPSAVFSSPAIATVGPTAETLEKSGIAFDVFSAEFSPMMFSFADETERERNVYRLFVERGSDRVLAAHLLGRDAPEIMQMLAVAIHAGATKADFDAVVGIHPTSAEELVTLT